MWFAGKHAPKPMTFPISPGREDARLSSLHSYELLDTLPEASLDDLTKLAAQICGVPIALISLIDENRQWFKSRVGLDVPQTSLDASFCLHTIQKPGLFIVPDATQDPRFAANPLVINDTHVRFYAGTPLLSPEGEALGTLCVMDHHPRHLTTGQEEALRVLGRQVMVQLETRRQTRELLATAADRANILASSMDAIIVMDVQELIREFNPAAETLFGWTRESVIGQRLGDVIISKDVRQQHREGLTHHLLTGEGPIVGNRTELTALRADGSLFPVELSVARSPGKGAPRFIGFIRDISERHAAEAALRESEERFRGTFEQAAVGIAHVGPDGRFLRVNDKLCGILGYAREDLLGKVCAEFTVPEDRAPTDKARRAMVAGEQVSATLEKRYRRRNGEVVWVNLIATLERTPSGDPKYFTSVFEDITARKLTEFRLLRLNRLHTVLSCTGEATVRASDREQLYAAVCRVLVEDGLLRMAFIAELDPQHREMDPVAGCGAGLDYLNGLVITTDGSAFSRGTVGTVMRTGHHDVCNDVATDPRMAPWRDRALAQGFYATASFPLKRDGAVIGALVLFAGEPGYFQNDEVRLMVDVANNVSFALEAQRKEQRREQAVSALRASGMDLLRAQRIAHLGSWEQTLATGKLQWSEETYHIFGMDSAGFGGTYEAFLAAVHPDDQESVLEAHRSALTGHSGMDLEHRIVRPDGTWRWVHELAELERDRDGQPVRLMGTILDITARKTTSDALEENERQLRALAHQLQKEQARLIEAQALAKVGSWETDLATMEVIWSAEVYHITGQDSEKFTPTHETFLDLVHPEDREMVDQSFQQSLGDASTRTIEHRLLLPDGTIKFVEERWHSLTGSRGKVGRVFGTCRDITERRTLEQQFLRSQRMESIGTLAGGIAHDLNNALAPIIMSLDLMKMRFPDEESLDLLGIVSSSAQRGADMVRQVLSFARGVEGRREVVRIPLLVEEIAKITNETFLKHIRIRTSLAADLWTVLGDPTQLHQVLLNLCVNARDAMPQGGDLTISSENVSIDNQYAGLNDEAKPGNYIQVQVEDTGSGMPPEVIEKIFDPFFTTKDLGKGTGLGLSTTLAIIRSHGGFLRVESTPGSGTRFKIYLPAQSGPAPETPQAGESNMPRGHGELILVVDDELRVRQITQQTLEAFGYRVVLACEGAEAVAIYASRASEIAAVLTDMMMPLMDGPAAILVLRRLNPELPILAASGLAVQEQVAKATSLGVKHFLPKPYTAEALLTILDEVLQERRANLPSRFPTGGPA